MESQVPFFFFRFILLCVLAWIISFCCCFLLTACHGYHVPPSLEGKEKTFPATITRAAPAATWKEQGMEGWWRLPQHTVPGGGQEWGGMCPAASASLQWNKRNLNIVKLIYFGCSGLCLQNKTSLIFSETIQKSKKKKEKRHLRFHQQKEPLLAFSFLKISTSSLTHRKSAASYPYPRVRGGRK